MPEFSTHRTVPFTPEQMFTVVADIEAYSQFVPHCVRLQILSREKSGNAEIVNARMAIRYGIFEESYTSRVVLDKDALAIDVKQIEGPFSYLVNTWRFEQDGKGTKIHFYLGYEFRSRTMTLLSGGLFQKMFRNYEEAFERRASQIYR